MFYMAVTKVPTNWPAQLQNPRLISRICSPAQNLAVSVVLRFWECHAIINGLRAYVAQRLVYQFVGFMTPPFPYKILCVTRVLAAYGGQYPKRKSFMTKTKGRVTSSSYFAPISFNSHRTCKPSLPISSWRWHNNHSLKRTLSNPQASQQQGKLDLISEMDKRAVYVIRTRGFLPFFWPPPPCAVILKVYN